MKFGRITRDTMIAGEEVRAGEVVEVDDSTFGQLKRANAIEKCAAPDGSEPEPKKAKPKFTRFSKTKSEAAAEQ